jgi:hypothetical protein
LLKKGARRRLATVIHWLRRDSDVLVRGGDNRSGELFSYVDLEARVRRDHRLRPIRMMTWGMFRTIEEG